MAHWYLYKAHFHNATDVRGCPWKTSAVRGGCSGDIFGQGKRGVFFRCEHRTFWCRKLRII